MIKQKSSRLSRFAPPSETPPVTPTPERLDKSMFTRGSPPRVLTTVQALLKSGDVEQDCADAGERWLRDYNFAFHDYIEYSSPDPIDATTRHDAVSWHVLRALTCTRVANVRRALGDAAHLRLRLIYVEELSFAHIGRILFPRLSPTVARGKTSAQISLILEQLRDFYREDYKSKKKSVDNRMRLC